MNAVIVVGDRVRVLSDKTATRAKHVIEIRGKPLLWGLISLDRQPGLHEFVVATGHIQEVPKEHFHHFFTFYKDFRVEIATGKANVLRPTCYGYEGFGQPVDTLRDKRLLEDT
jgi:NDP-sugar pyrophosphorylase family protein